MKERPILMSGEMVRATLREINPKTQTRRTNGLKEINEFPDHWKFDRCFDDDGTYAFTYTGGEFQGELIKCPFGKVGDRLWVRETFFEKCDPDSFELTGEYCYAATERQPVYQLDEDGGVAENKDGSTKSPWKPSIHMPRKASRITLEITNIRVERLNDIRDEDAYAEGIQPQCRTPKEAFAVLWNQIYGSWDKNPWVWVIEFKVVHP